MFIWRSTFTSTAYEEHVQALTTHRYLVIRVVVGNTVDDNRWLVVTECSAWTRKTHESKQNNEWEGQKR